MELLRETVCVVTGAAGGLGGAISDRLAAAGGTPVLVDVDEDALEAAATRVERRHGTRPPTLTLDIGDAAAVAAAAAELEDSVGRCRVLVNNAAVYRRAPLEEQWGELWERTLDVNLSGYFHCTVAFGRSMLAAGGGSIVNVSSIAGRGPTPMAAAYCVSKAGVVALTKQTALEWGPRGVRANAVSPGFLNTSMASVAYDEQEELTRRRRERVPVGRIAEPDDVAAVVAFLAGPESAYVNGVDLVVDGGLTQTLSASFPR